MGSLCGKEAPSGTEPTTRIASSNSRKPKVGGLGRTLGGGGGEGGPASDEDPRAAAARAAEARTNSAKGGKLANQLDQQKKKSMNQHIGDNRAPQEPMVWD